MNVLALDLGTRCGWALRAPAVPRLSGVIDLRPQRHEGGGMRYLRFRQELTGIHKRVPLDIVVYEEVRRHMSTDAAHVYGGLLATMAAFCEEEKIPFEGVPVQTIKKFITGKGNAGKEEVIAAVKSLGYKPKDDNEADAMALLIYKLNQLKAK